jgi:carboxymethylenebutenolidase
VVDAKKRVSWRSLREETMNEPERHLLDVWQRHVLAEFVHKNVEDALALMTEDAHVLLVPSLTGGKGKPEVRAFYAGSFLPQIPPDIEPVLLSQTVGQDRIVEESVYRFTHSIAMDWMLPGIAPTGKRVEVAVIGVIQFRDGLIAHEHLYWDQASALVQLGVLAPGGLPVHGAASAGRLLQLAHRAGT